MSSSPKSWWQSKSDRMYTPSPELAAVVTRWNEAVRTKDTESLRNMLSDSEMLRYVGTAQGEFWGGEILRQGIGDHLGEVPEFHYRDARIEAFECGQTGWALWTGFIYFPNTDVLSDYRISFVFGLERGLWKIVQIHISNPTPNFEKLGIEHQALDALMAAAEAGNLGLGKEGMATIMFTDVVDSSILAGQMGDRAWLGRIDQHLQSVQQLVADNGGTLVKSLGDGTMSTFNSTRAALKAAKAIQHNATADTQEPVLRLRIGIHTGEVIENKGDFFGTVVNKAARINAAAAPGETLVSEATQIILGHNDGFVLSDPKEMTLKGLPGTHRLYRLTG